MLLGLFAYAGGVGTTALGPGGVLVTIGLFLFSGLPPAAISGTAIATNLGAAVLGTGAFTRSGQLSAPGARRVAGVLVAAAVIGTPVGVLANAHVSGAAFGVLLGVCVAAIGALLIVRERRQRTAPRVAGMPAWTVIAPIGLGVAVVSGLFGLGGQLLSVPLLVSAGIAMLPALGAAQAQSIVIAGVGTIGYALRGAIAWPLIGVMGIPLLAGALTGWRVAQAIPADRLRSLLAGVLIATGAYLILRNV